MEHELRAIRFQQTEDITCFTDLTEGFLDHVKVLQAKPGSLMEEVLELRQDVNDLLETQTTSVQEIYTRFSRIFQPFGQVREPTF